MNIEEQMNEWCKVYYPGGTDVSYYWLCYRLETPLCDSEMTYPDSLTKELILWENVNADEYVRRTQADVQQSIETRVKETQDR